MATTRYREYFAEADTAAATGPAQTVDVPSSARPPGVRVRHVLPAFRWTETVPEDAPHTLIRRRSGALRAYLERPWYASGDGELLAVVTAEPGSTVPPSDPRRRHLARWGLDPVRPATDLPKDAPQSVHFLGDDVVRAAGLRLPEPTAPPDRWRLPRTPCTTTRAAACGTPTSDRTRAVPTGPSSTSPSPATSRTPCPVSNSPRPPAWTRSRPSPTAPPNTPGPTSAPCSSRSPASRRQSRCRTHRAECAPGWSSCLPARPTRRTWDGSAWGDVIDLPLVTTAGTIHTWSEKLALPAGIPFARPGGTFPSGWRVVVEEWERLPYDSTDAEPPAVAERVTYTDQVGL
ncbi:hypothetical protein GCM10020000_01610 [Streptomyces olivoverticillatus]